MGDSFTPDDILEQVTVGFAAVHGISIEETESFFRRYGVDDHIREFYKLFAYNLTPGWVHMIQEHVDYVGGMNYPEPELYGAEWDALHIYFEKKKAGYVITQ